MDAGERKSDRAILAAILIAAAALRLYPVPADLPFGSSHDEWSYIEDALRMGTGSLAMEGYKHGGFYQLLLFLQFGALFALGRLGGTFHTATDFFLQYLRDPTLFFVIARMTVVLCAVATVLLCALLGRKAYNPRVGLVGGLFAACALLLVESSSFAWADMPAVFFLLLALWNLSRGPHAPFPERAYLLSCALVGLAAACKYTAVFGMAPMFAAVLLGTRGRGWRPPVRLLALGGATAAAAFFGGFPSALLHPMRLYQDAVVGLGGEYIASAAGENLWLVHFTEHLRNGLGLPLEAAALLGLVYAAYKRSAWDIILLSFPVPYFLFIMNGAVMAHHWLPAAPFLLILAARAVEAVCAKFFPRAPLAAALALAGAVALPTLVDSLKFAVLMRAEDTRRHAKNWIEENIPEGAKVLAEGYIQTTPYHGPALVGTPDSVKRDLASVLQGGGRGFVARLQAAHFDRIFANARKRYDLYKARVLETADWESHRPEYVVLSGACEADLTGAFAHGAFGGKGYLARRPGIRSRLLTRYEPLKTFESDTGSSWMYTHVVDADYRFRRNTPLAALAGWRKGPRIEVLRLRPGTPGPRS